jgi:hypothetical protein
MGVAAAVVTHLAQWPYFGLMALGIAAMLIGWRIPDQM